MKNQGSYQSHFKKAKAVKTPISRSLTEAEVEAQLRKAFGMKEDPQVSNTSVKRKSNKSKKANRPSSTLYPVVALMAMFVGISSYMVFPRAIDDIFSRIEFSYMGEASAEEDDGQKSPSTKSNEKANASSAKGKEDLSQVSEQKNPVTEDLSYLSKLRERKTALDLREAELNQLEEELHRQKIEIEKRIAELSEIREEVKTKLEDRVEADEGKVKKLVELYSSMKPKQAAKIIESVNTHLAVEVLAGMKKKSAADIMNVMDEKVAKELSERLTGYKRTPANAN